MLLERLIGYEEVFSTYHRNYSYWACHPGLSRHKILIIPNKSVAVIGIIGPIDGARRLIFGREAGLFSPL